jgi:hypothetical protein
MPIVYKADKTALLERARQENIVRIRAEHVAIRDADEYRRRSGKRDHRRGFWVLITVLILAGAVFIASTNSKLELAEAQRAIEAAKARIDMRTPRERAIDDYLDRERLYNERHK